MPRTNAYSLAAVALLAWASAAKAETPCGSWIPAPLPGAAGHGLASVSASSATDVWAVWRAIYHWDGKRWDLVPAPGLGSQDTVLRAVASVAPDDAWVVGYTAFLGTPQTLVERWDGSQWSVIPSPVVSGGSEFDAVVALGANDVWAVGDRAGGLPEFQATRATLTAHWDGSSWTAIPSPNTSNRSHSLLDIAAIATDDVWAVGFYRNMGENYQTLIIHWDGSSWSITPSPNHPGENILHGVSGTSADDVWAVGEAWDGVTARQIFLHWNGEHWGQVTGTGEPTACVGCTGDVLVMGHDDVWAVGSTMGHWNGTQWTVLPNAVGPEAMGITLRSIARTGDCDAWSVGGSFDTDGVESALSIHLTTHHVSIGGSADHGIVALRVSPNPSRGESVIQLALPPTRRVRISILDVMGRQVREVVSVPLAEGEHTFRWDGLDAAGIPVGPGFYFVTAAAGDQRVSAAALRLR